MIYKLISVSLYSPPPLPSIQILYLLFWQRPGEIKNSAVYLGGSSPCLIIRNERKKKTGDVHFALYVLFSLLLLFVFFNVFFSVFYSTILTDIFLFFFFPYQTRIVITAHHRTAVPTKETHFESSFRHFPI